MKDPTKNPWALDLDDHRTSTIERALVWIVIGCAIIGTISEAIQAAAVIWH